MALKELLYFNILGLCPDCKEKAYPYYRSTRDGLVPYHCIKCGWGG